MLEVQFATCFEERCLKFAALLLEFAPRAVEFRDSVYGMLEVSLRARGAREALRELI